MADLMKMQWYWLIWLALLGAINIMGAMVFIKSREGQFTMLAMISNMVLMMALHSQFGMVRLLGLGHIFWVPLLIYLGTTLSKQTDSLKRRWMVLLICINSASLVIDVIDVIRYLSGDTSVTV